MLLSAGGRPDELAGSRLNALTSVGGLHVSRAAAAAAATTSRDPLVRRYDDDDDDEASAGEQHNMGEAVFIEKRYFNLKLVAAVSTWPRFTGLKVVSRLCRLDHVGSIDLAGEIHRLAVSPARLGRQRAACSAGPLRAAHKWLAPKQSPLRPLDVLYKRAWRRLAWRRATSRRTKRRTKLAGFSWPACAL